MSKEKKHTIQVTEWHGKWVVDFNAFCYAESEEEAKQLFDRMSEACEDIVCGLPEDHEVCPRMWTMGGQIKTEQQFEAEN